MDALLDMINNGIQVDIDGLLYKACANKKCASNGALLPSYMFRWTPYLKGGRYADSCRECEKKYREFYKAKAIDRSILPEGVALVRGEPGINRCIENPYQPHRLSTKLKRAVHIIGEYFTPDIIITRCGRIFDEHGFIVNDDLLNYGKLCDKCVKLYYKDNATNADR